VGHRAEQSACARSRGSNDAERIEYVAIHSFLLPPSDFSRFQSIQILSHPWNAVCEFNGSPEGPEAFQWSSLMLQGVIGDPLLGFTRDLEKGFEVIETE